MKLIIKLMLILLIGLEGCYAEGTGKCENIDALAHVSSFVSKPSQVIADTFMGDNSLAIAGKYANAENNSPQVFVILLSCDGREWVKKETFEFYSQNIEVLKYHPDEDRLYVIFKRDTEQYGWVEKTTKGHSFSMFSDPEM